MPVCDLYDYSLLYQVYYNQPLLSYFLQACYFDCIIYNYRFKPKHPMKILRAISEKVQKTSSSKAYLAQSIIKTAEFSRVSYVEVKWTSVGKQDFHSTFEQKSLIEENSKILNDSKDQMRRQAETNGGICARKCLFKLEFRYYSVDFDANQAEFENMKGFLLTQIGNLVSHAKMNQQNRLFPFYLQGRNQLGENPYPKLTIKLVDRCDLNSQPFVNLHQKKQILRHLARKQTSTNRESSNDDIEASLSHANSQNFSRNQNEEAVYQLHHHERAIQMLSKFQSSQNKTIKQGSSSIKSYSAPKQEGQQAAAKNSYNIETNKLKQLFNKKVGQRARIQNTKESYHPLNNLVRRRLHIQDHHIDEKGKWTFKGQKDDETFLLTERQLYEQGFEKEVRKYKMLVSHKLKPKSKEI